MNLNLHFNKITSFLFCTTAVLVMCALGLVAPAWGRDTVNCLAPVRDAEKMDRQESVAPAQLVREAAEKCWRI